MKKGLILILLSIAYYSNAQFQINGGVSPIKKCPLDTLILSATTGANYTNYQWFDINDPSIILSTSNTLPIITLPNTFGVSYRCRVLNTSTSLNDSAAVFVQYQTYAKIELGNDTTLCQGDSLVIKNKEVLNQFLYFQHSWNFNADTNKQITVYNSGTYTLHIKGPIPSSTCVNADSIKVTFTPGVVFNAGTDTTICFGESVVLNPTEIFSGVTPYFYSWNNASTLSDPSIKNPTATPTSTTTYTLNVKDSGGSGGCESNSNVTITVNPEITATPNFTDSIVCKNVIVGLDVLAAGGTSLFNGYNYLWQINGNGTVSNNSINNPNASISGITSFVCQVSDSLGCTTNTTIQLQPTSLQTSIADDTINNCLNTALSVSGLAQGGNGTYSIAWTGAAGFASPNALTSAVSISNSNYIYLSVTDQNNCTDKDSVYVKVNAIPTVNIPSVSDSICQGNTLNISAFSSGGSGNGYQFNWTPNLQNITTGNVSNLSYSTFQTGIQTIYVNVTDANNCTSSLDSIKVKPIFAPYVNLGSADTAICDSITLSVPFNSGFMYVWRDTISNTILGNGASITVNNLSTYQIEVTSSNGCKNIDKITLTRIPLLILNSLIVSDTVLTTDQVANLSATSNSNNATYNWTTTGSGELTNTNQATNIYTPSLSDDGIITINLNIKNECISIDSIIKLRINKLNKTKNIFIPNVFSPNASLPENRVLRVYGNNIVDTEFSLKVVNKWGALVYESNSFTDANLVGWTAEKEQDGVYSYVVKGKFNDGTEFSKPGTITLLK